MQKKNAKWKKGSFYIVAHIFCACLLCLSSEHIFWAHYLSTSFHIRPITAHSILTNHILSYSILTNHKVFPYLTKLTLFHFDKSHIDFSHSTNRCPSYSILTNHRYSSSSLPITNLVLFWSINTVSWLSDQLHTFFWYSTNHSPYYSMSTTRIQSYHIWRIKARKN